MQSTLALATLVPNLQAFAEALVAGRYAFEIIDRESKINAFNNVGEIPSELTGDIEFKNVHFSYPARQNMPV